MSMREIDVSDPPRGAPVPTITRFALVALLALHATPALASPQPPQPLGIGMEGYPYPSQVKQLPLKLEGQDLRMAYMDVAPTGPANGRAVLLLHGKNFFGAYWEGPIRALTAAGFRVIVPDQLGFGKSSKPDLHYSFELLAQNTKKLLDELAVEKVVVVGHSMGGMLAVRFALMYPTTTTQLVLENPIGLEDYRAKVPYQSIEANYQNTLGQTEESLRKFIGSYFAHWSDAFEAYVQVPYRWTLSAEYPRYARASALTYDMIYTQPIVQDLPRIRTPTLLVIGQADRTVVGRQLVSKEILATLGDWAALGKRAAAAIPGARLVEVAGVGHVPHLEAPQKFEEALLAFLR
jgi:pimeloyl-ACP methyl ester carboxylesterase